MRKDSGLTKFFTWLIQYSDFEILEHNMSMWGLKLKYSSKYTPRSLKLLSALVKEILSIGEIRAGSSGRPISVLLYTTLQIWGSIGLLWVLKIMYFVFEAFKYQSFAV